ncbi:DUF2924 domain-containing protein [bacterium]|nr:DUF2924 domain-containing protein [bacterium]
MKLCLDKELESLKEMTVSQLQRKYAEVFGEPTRAHNKPFLWKRIAWRLQMQAEGDISERARRRAAELAREEDLRIRAPKGAFAPSSPADKARTVVLPFKPAKRDERLPAPGTMLGRIYKGRRVEVEVLEEGFRFKGRNYPTLTAVAQEITGTHWNGYEFFGLRKRGNN